MAQLIYFDEIPLTYSIMDVIEGKTVIHITNPFFAGKGLPPFDKDKNWFIKKASAAGNDKSKGVYYSGPSIALRKSTTADFGLKNRLVLMKNKQTSASYMIFRPYGETIALKSSMKLRYIVLDSPWTDQIVLLDTRLNMVLEILLVSRILAINLTQCAGFTNDQLFEFLNNEINAKLTALAKGKKFTAPKFEPKYIEMWNIPPVYVKDEAANSSIRVARSDVENETDQVFEAPAQYQIPNVISRLLTKVSFTGLTAGNTGLKPSNFNRAYKNKEDQLAFMPSFNMSFKIKMPNSKIPDSLLSKRLVSNKGVKNFIIQTDKNIANIWGGVDSKRLTFKGFFIISLALNLGFFSIGTSLINWDVDQFNGKEAKATAIQIAEDEMPDVIDDCNDDDELPSVTASNVRGLSGGDDEDIELDNA